MAAINTSISYQSQFSTPNPTTNNIRTKSGAQANMEVITGLTPKPINPKFTVQNVAPVDEIGKHFNLKA